MKTGNKAVCMVAAGCSPAVKELGKTLSTEGISAIVIQKEAAPAEPQSATQQWSGQPGKDLFFNGWKLLF